MQQSNRAGQAEGLKLWGEVCKRQTSCQNCQIGVIAGANVSCQEFASKFPMKMLHLLEEMAGKDKTYYEEFCIRFPEMNLIVEDLADCACRKAVFEGYLDCDKSGDDCVKCWLDKYIGDRTEKDEFAETSDE